MVVDLQNVNAFLKETDETKQTQQAKKGKADDFLEKMGLFRYESLQIVWEYDGLFRFSRGKRERDLPLEFQNNTWYHPNG